MTDTKTRRFHSPECKAKVGLEALGTCMEVQLLWEANKVYTLKTVRLGNDLPIVQSDDIWKLSVAEVCVMNVQTA
jgi:hypothetical protein